MWRPISESPEKLLVMTKVDDDQGCRNEQIMKRESNLWFAGDMYVYYRPTHWRELTMVEKLKLKNENERVAIAALERANQSLGI